MMKPDDQVLDPQEAAQLRNKYVTAAAAGGSQQGDVAIIDWLDLRVKAWLDTWAPHCGASRKTFEGQWRAMMADIFDNIEERAEAAMMKTHKLEGMHYAALSAVRRELQLRSRSSVRSEPRDN